MVENNFLQKHFPGNRLNPSERVRFIDISLRLGQLDGDDLKIAAEIYKQIIRDPLQDKRKYTKELYDEKIIDLFVAKYCLSFDDSKVKSSEIYNLFKTWCLKINIKPPPSQKWFGNRFCKFFNRRKSGIYWYIDLQISQPAAKKLLKESS